MPGTNLTVRAGHRRLMWQARKRRSRIVRGVRLSSIHVFPVKSLGGFDVEQRVVFRWGLDGDRRWMLIDSAGENVTARTDRVMLTIEATLGPDDTLMLAAAGRSVLTVRPPLGLPGVSVQLSRLDSAVPADPEAHRWLSDVLGRDVRLVWMPDPTARSVGSHHGGRPGDPLNLADAAPILLTTQSSLDRLNAWMAETAEEVGEEIPDPIPMQRFRPNLVLDGPATPFEEDTWRELRIGSLRLRASELCDRCVMTTIDVATLRSSKEPIRTLARHRRWDRSVWFGARLVPLEQGTVAVGDPVEVLG